MKYILFMVAGLVFIGCGDVDIEKCSSGEYTQILKGDILTKQKKNTEITLLHVEGKKSICVRSGEAYLIRD